MDNKNLGLTWKCEFHDVSNMSSSFQSLPIDKNVFVFGILLDYNEFTIHEINEPHMGSIYVPFKSYLNKKELVSSINFAASEFANYLKLHLSTKENKEISFLIKVFRYLDSNNNRFFAIGAINSDKKDPTIDDLKIKTPLRSLKKTDSEVLWNCISEEYLNIDDFYCYEIKMDEIPFQDQFEYPVSLKKSDVFILNSKKSEYLYQHFNEPTKRRFDDRLGRFANLGNFTGCSRGSVYSAPSRTLDSLEEVDVLCVDMAKAFKHLIGNPSIKFHVLYFINSEDKYEISILCYNKLVKEEEEDDEY